MGQRYLLCLAVMGLALLAGGCASENGASSVMKTRGIYTTVAMDGHHLDLPGSQYISCKSFTPGQTPAAVVVGYGTGDSINQRAQPFTVELVELATGAVLFSRDGDAWYGKAAVLELPIRKSGAYKVRLIINHSEFDSWQFTVDRGDGPASAAAPAKAYAQGSFGGSMTDDTGLEAFYPYNDRLLQDILNAVDRLAANTDRSTFAQIPPGHVEIHFVLTDHGQVLAPQITENTLNEALGIFFQQALTNGSPYQPWPAAPHQAYGHDARNIQMTFIYN